MKITFTLNDINEANAILGVLGKLPYEQIVDLINRLRAQADEQLKQAPPA
jgi:hypothetical protein